MRPGIPSPRFDHMERYADLDLLVAAATETARIIVLHLDKDFELIAEITGQETRRLQ
jgi:predicted nucleic acid-binding protein